jgi:hypothetical protein
LWAVRARVTGRFAFQASFLRARPRADDRVVIPDFKSHRCFELAVLRKEEK